MKAIILTADEIRNSSGRNYNPQVWDSKIERMITNYKDVVFYLVEKDDVYGYDRYFVEYTLPEGLRLFSSFGYSTSITSGGFYRLDKAKVTDDGKQMSDVIGLMEEGRNEEAVNLMIRIEDSKFLKLSYGTFFSADGKEGVYDTTTRARIEMTEKSKKYKITFTKGR